MCGGRGGYGDYRVPFWLPIRWINSDYSQPMRPWEDWCESLFRPCCKREFDPGELHVKACLQLQTGKRVKRSVVFIITYLRRWPNVNPTRLLAHTDASYLEKKKGI